MGPTAARCCCSTTGRPPPRFAIRRSSTRRPGAACVQSPTRVLATRPRRLTTGARSPTERRTRRPSSTRCTRTTSSRSVGPVAGLTPWLAGMGPENIAEFGAAIVGEDRLVPYLDREAAPLRAVTGTDVAAALGGLLSEVDKNALTGDSAAVLAETFRRAVSGGIAGWRDDDLAFTRPWGFELKSIRVPVAIWHGAQDRMVPFAHGRWLAANIPGAQPRLLDDEGHISVLNHIDRILEDLVELGTEHL